MTLCKMQIELSTVVDAQQIIVTCELAQGHSGAHLGTIRWPVTWPKRPR